MAALNAVAILDFVRKAVRAGGKKTRRADRHADSIFFTEFGINNNAAHGQNLSEAFRLIFLSD